MERKTLLRKLARIRTTRDLTQLIDHIPAAARLMLEWIQSDTAGVCDDTARLAAGFRPDCHADDEWKSDSNLPLIDRLLYLKCFTTGDPVIRLWNLYHLTRMLASPFPLAGACLDLIDRKTQEFSVSDPKLNDVLKLLKGVKVLAWRTVAVLDPFNHAAAALAYAEGIEPAELRTLDEQLWGEVMLSWANILLWQVRGELSVVRERAIGILHEVEVFVSADMKHRLWVTLYNTIGNAYDRHITGDPVENYEKAIASYMKAEQALQSDLTSPSWASNQNNLGLLHRKRIRGDKGENLEKSIRYLEAALEGHLRYGSPMHAAQTMTNLGVSYTERVMGDRAENLETAIRYYRRALRILTRTRYPGYHAWTSHNLGTIYHYLRKGSRGRNIERAIACYQDALTFRTRDKNPLEWVISTRNLALALQMRKRGDPVHNRDQAVMLLREILPATPRDRLPVEWARTTAFLGQALGRGYPGDSAGQLDQAAGLLAESLTVLTPERLPFESRQAAFALGCVHMRRHCYDDAVSAFETAMRADEHRYRQSFLGRSQAAEISIGSSIYFNLALCDARLDRPIDALRHLERGKLRMLSERFQLDRVRFDRIPEDDRVQYQKLADRLRALQIEQYIPSRPMSEIIDETSGVRRNLDELIVQFQKKEPDFMQAEIDVEDNLAHLARDAAIVHFDVTEFGTAVFLTRMEEGTLRVDYAINDMFTVDTLSRFMSLWSRGQLATRRMRDTNRAEDIRIDRLMKRLSRELLAPVAHLFRQEFHRVVLVPHLSMHVLPLHLLRIGQGSRILCLDRIVSYLPSLAIEAFFAGGDARPANTFVGVSNPTLDLRWAQHEVERISAFFDERNRCVLNGSDASCEAVRTVIRDAGYIHFACHARFDADEPYRSCLVLAPSHDSKRALADEARASDSRVITMTIANEPLMLSEIFAELKLSGKPLVVLSACESGLTVQETVSDEFIGFPAGFLLGGASAVLSSLWSVDDEATSLLMEHFYRNMIVYGETPDESLSHAQKTVREVPGFENPYFWAGFKLTAP